MALVQRHGARFPQGAHQLLEKERHALGFFHHQLDEFVLDPGGPKEGGQYLAAVTGRQARQGDGTMIGLARPYRDKLRPVGAHEQDGRRGNLP